MLLTENMNESEDRDVWLDAKPGRRYGGVGVWGDAAWARGMSLVLACSPSWADAVKSAADMFL